MEEDIKYLDKMVKEYKQFGDLCNPEYEDTDRIYQALENLIKGYRELEEENAELKEESCCMTTCMRKDKEKLFLENKRKEIRDKAEVMDYYTLPDVIEDLNKLLEDK